MDSSKNTDDIASSGRIEATDDVEGHVSSNRVNPDELGNDVSGHRVPHGIEAEETDDLEGHKRIYGLQTEGADDVEDTEAHGRFNV